MLLSRGGGGGEASEEVPSHHHMSREETNHFSGGSKPLIRRTSLNTSQLWTQPSHEHHMTSSTYFTPLGTHLGAQTLLSEHWREIALHLGLQGSVCNT